MKQNKPNRREVLKKVAAGSIGLIAASTGSIYAAPGAPKLKGNVNHAVCRWTYNHLSLDELCIASKNLGIKAIDLIGPKEWGILKKHGLDSSMCNGAEISLEKGWNDPQYHDVLVKNYSEMIPLVAKAGYKNLICFSGNINGMDLNAGMENCAKGLGKILSLAEKHGVVIQMELFNSKVNHPDYMCDNTTWGVALCEKIGSANFKLLYDIYHMQISEGDLISTIKKHHQWFGHYHTAGVPGRNEIDESQEIYYPAVIRAIVETGYDGYVAQEFIPKAKDKMASLRRAIEICDV